MDNLPIYVVEKKYTHGRLYVRFSNGRIECHDAVGLGCEWLKTSAEAFYKKYNFTFDPVEHGMYNICKQAMIKEEQKNV